MSRLEVILSAFLILSVTFNVIVLIYARAAVIRLLSFSDELGDLQVMINSFANHVKSVYELEMFYGDATLRHLMDHAISFNEQLETFEYIYSLSELPQIDTQEDEEIDEEENTTPQE